MENIDLKQYPLATLFAWRAPIFLGKHGATPEAEERREIRAKVIAEVEHRRCPPLSSREVDEYEDLL